MGGSVPELDAISQKVANPQDLSQLRQEVAQLINRNSLSFPGAQPVSFARKHIQELHERDYYVCEKSDGIRCLLYFTTRFSTDGPEEQHFLIDRKNNYYFVPGLHFPDKPHVDWESYHTNTLLDGELLYDTYPNGHRELKYLVFDCLVLDGQHLMNRTLDKRLAYFMQKLYEPWVALCKAFPEDSRQFRFKIEKKSFQLGYGAVVMFDDIIPRLKHGCDGLIFTCVVTPYTFGTDENILKWKPAEENTIDFKLELEFPPNDEAMTNDEEEVWEYDYGAMPRLILNVHYSDEDYRPEYEMYAEPSDWEIMKKHATQRNDGLDGAIVECHKDGQGRWRFNRFRDDKPEPNHCTVVQKVLDSIEDGVTKQDLKDSYQSIREAWKERAQKTERGRKQDEIKRREEEKNKAAMEQQLKRKRQSTQSGDGPEKRIKSEEAPDVTENANGVDARPSSSSQRAVSENSTVTRSGEPPSAGVSGESPTPKDED
ncbi:MAG: Dcp1p-Dcp2p decapping enzyme complex alpha subunit [Alyxoria varia]|nr:MAG: Dcp1p-Dcp2p decapping enzyme complex alpha subunit [Alyxoria varia]